MVPRAVKIYTVGHSNRSFAELVGLLRSVQIECLVDVRSSPRSRRNPQFNDDALRDALSEWAIDYLHLPSLGGRRSASNLAFASPNGAWSEDGFRNYADYALTEGFGEGLDQLRALAVEQTTVIMCAERDWQHCHRQIIADHLLARGIDVIHLIRPDESVAGKMTATAQIADGGEVIYPARQSELF